MRSGRARRLPWYGSRSVTRVEVQPDDTIETSTDAAANARSFMRYLSRVDAAALGRHQGVQRLARQRVLLGMRGFLRLPAAAEGPVELDDAEQRAQAVARERVLGREQLLLRLEYLVVVREAAAEARVREPHGVLQRHDLALELYVRRDVLLPGHERVRDLGEGVQHRALVGEHRLLPGRDVELVAVVEPAALEHRPGQLGG